MDSYLQMLIVKPLWPINVLIILKQRVSNQSKFITKLNVYLSNQAHYKKMSYRMELVQNQSICITSIGTIINKQFSYLIQKKRLTPIIITTIIMSQSLKLPQIGRPKSTQQPFKIPPDNQILAEKQQKSSQAQDQKIWDKKTASCRTALKRFDKYVIPQDTNFVPQYTFNSKDKKLIQSALEIIQMRKKNKDLQGKNQTIVDILQQKKEMFLVTMTHEIIDKEISNLKDQAEDREKALKESNDILEQDIKDFDQYQEKYKAQTKQIQQRFEKQVQQRIAIEQEIKKQQIVANSLRAQKTRNQQSISSYLVYKQFLDQLPPKQWITQKQQKKKGKLQQIKKQLQQKWVPSTTNKRNDKAQFQRYFAALIQSGQNKQLQEIMYNEQTYFEQPHQMIEFFNNLEETNLFCIQNSQYSEQKYQELKLQSQEKKNELKLKYEQLQQHKRALEKQLSELESSIGKMQKRKKEQNFSLDQKDTSNIKDSIKAEYQAAKQQMHSYMPQIQYNAESLALLSGIQICMQRLWQRLLQCYQQNPKAIKEIKTALQKKKNNEKREEAARNNKIQQEKRKIRNLEKKQPIMKVQGRIDMKRSPPQEKIVTKKIQTTGKDFDDDKKYLVE